MAFLKFTRVPRHKQFEYKPRFWNPEKEELEERLKRTEELKSDDPEAIKARISSGFRNKGYGYGDRELSFRRRETKRSNYTLLLIVAILLFAFWYFITNYLPQWASLFESGTN
ncbi:MAG: hypothetical protein ACK4TA_09145 [Saprospiraceae bacterium]